MDLVSLFKCGRDSTGIKWCTCIIGDSCRKEVQWFRKKAELEAHLHKAHNIRVILPWGLKIEEEEQSTSVKSTTTSFFSNYERQWPIMRFFYLELFKYNKSCQSYMRKLKTREFKNFKAIPNILQTSNEADFIARFINQEMARYNVGKEHRIA